MNSGSNYPPGVTGTEPQIAGYPEEPEGAPAAPTPAELAIQVISLTEMVKAHQQSITDLRRELYNVCRNLRLASGHDCDRRALCAHCGLPVAARDSVPVRGGWAARLCLPCANDKAVKP